VATVVGRGAIAVWVRGWSRCGIKIDFLPECSYVAVDQWRRKGSA
jgi:hypothetical protein